MANWLFPPLLKAPVSRDTFKHIHRWVANENRESRAALGEKGMGKTYRQTALDHISSCTPTKVIDGQKHYLLHRTMGGPEFRANVKGGLVEVPERMANLSKFTNFTSWGADPDHCPRNVRSHVVGAWVPESHVSFYPLAYKEKFEKMFPFSDAGRYMEMEKEAIVKPGKFRVVHSYSVDPKRVNSFGESEVDLTPQDISTYQIDARRKVNNGG